jgi:hypothetical protein
VLSGAARSIHTEGARVLKSLTVGSSAVCFFQPHNPILLMIGDDHHSDLQHHFRYRGMVRITESAQGVSSTGQRGKLVRVKKLVGLKAKKATSRVLTLAGMPLGFEEELRTELDIIGWDGAVVFGHPGS